MKVLVTLSLFAAFLLCPTACADGVREGLSLAAMQALPALFPFFVISGLLVRCGTGRLSPLLAAPLRRLYGLPPEAAPALVLGLIGGYPVGAATACALYDEGVLSRGVKVTGATVHFVDEGTDTGPIILQKAVEVEQDDTPEILQRRVMEQAEWIIMPKAIDLIANGRVSVVDGRVRIED